MIFSRRSTPGELEGGGRHLAELDAERGRIDGQKLAEPLTDKGNTENTTSEGVELRVIVRRRFLAVVLPKGRPTRAIVKTCG
ncbi:hypothetical protein [Streptomyces mirabilis]|uniref:hypothetical protein n=1 Tax=Streptomyces mirabilis TaxID=68239 RepID=UPI0036B44022